MKRERKPHSDSPPLGFAAFRAKRGKKGGERRKVSHVRLMMAEEEWSPSPFLSPLRSESGKAERERAGVRPHLYVCSYVFMQLRERNKTEYL